MSAPPPPTDGDLAGQLTEVCPYSRSVCLGIVQECRRRNHPPPIMGAVARQSWMHRVSPELALAHLERQLLGA